ncbi:MAG: SusC/RagA family TonB-linked outer membrane protein [Saprospiraceae bacterium]|nr:SusC/RagA family TonB-linked outer membrane protein [Saprospiraceae bacterium]MCF8249955.1 SusC/RagA family TonB-linked outer membrane protein [Saprospiraceae bacterium]MCF8279368.1 SusC/RagA family TonB-linked outer membrane protein [Bacteroidales bacterium]MCF8310059.1 SusC/RagA family TonB-linked outer membrane protein [Saprospiraceae bacterium]MCF8438959.1 SusC/RagA family TonB-linked outer membrane protein [Saprospiraceae bacterium]
MKLKFDYLTRCLLLLFVVMGMSGMAMAQRTIKGTVTDAKSGESLIGANVLILGTSAGTITDIDGTYELRVPADATAIEFTYTGYASQKVTLTASNVYDVAMDAGSLLNEVVVVGYGTVRKSDLTGSVVSVGEEDFNKGVVVSPDQLIQGKAAGVQILNNSGQPGAGTTIRIRGNSSIRAGNQPLFVIDGVQLTGNPTKPGANVGSGYSNNAAPNPLSYLNPSDIESMQVLKDASATAIYGSRGANGVIIITTKKGRSGTPVVEFSPSIGFSGILNKYDVLSGDEYRNALKDYGLTTGDYGKSVNAMDEILQTGITQNYNMSISGGSSAATYRAGFSYFDQDGIVKNSNLKRYTANLSGNYKFLNSERLGLDWSLITSYTKEKAPPISTNAGFEGSLIGQALQWNPTSAMYNADGTPVIIPEFGNTSINPLAMNDAYHDNSTTVDILGNISPYFKITDALTYKFAYSVTHGVGDRRAYINSWINIAGITDNGVAGINNEKSTNRILTHSLSYLADIASGINLNAVAGYEYQKLTESGFGVSTGGFPLGDFDYTNILQSAKNTTNTSLQPYSNPNAYLQSYFVRANFNIQDKYLLTGTFRADGSSKFGSDNQYGYFPAVGLAWNMHNENFLSGGPFNTLKLRLGWGKTGNSEFPSGASQERYSVGFNGTNHTAGLDNVANPGLKWETTTNYNAGIDFAILDYKVTGTLEYFNKSTEDLLFQNPTIQPAPASFYWINLPGKVVNTGVELSLNTTIIDNGSMTWDFGGNVTFLKNELQDYDGASIEYGQVFGQGSSGATVQKLVNGKPLNSFYTRHFIGIGDDGQGMYEGGSDETQAFRGDANPDMLLGLSTSLTKDKWGFVMNFNGAFGGLVYNNTKMSVIPISNLGTRNIDASLVGTSKQEATSNPIKASDRFLEKGDYLKLANATLSYNLGKLGNNVKNVKIYLTGQNLLVFTNYSGFDPEVNTVNELNGLPSTGIEYIPYPSARSVIVGANFSF